MALVDKGFYDRHGVKCVFGKKAVSIDTNKKSVTLEDGSVIAYDRLLIATGASPKRLDLDYPSGAPVFTLRTIEDAERIRDSVPDGGRVVFSGAGLVSLQAASALREKLGRMSFIVGSKQILSQNLELRAAAIVQRWLESRGADFFFERSIRSIVQIENGMKVGAPIVVHTDEGKAISVDAVVVGKGVQPNIPRLEPAGAVYIGAGIRVDGRMQTLAEGVYAAGDVCEAKDIISGEYRVVATWPNACMQGRVAGQNMAGGAVSYQGNMPMNVTSLFGLSFASIGCVWDSSDGVRESVSYADESSMIFKKWIFEGDRLVGAILLGDLREVTSVAPVIRQQRPIPKEKEALMADPGRAARMLSSVS
jgi:NAD(P)H-nitrite reductase large subunit